MAKKPYMHDLKVYKHDLLRMEAAYNALRDMWEYHSDLPRDIKARAYIVKCARFLALKAIEVLQPVYSMDDLREFYRAAIVRNELLGSGDPKTKKRTEALKVLALPDDNLYTALPPSEKNLIASSELLKPFFPALTRDQMYRTIQTFYILHRHKMCYQYPLETLDEGEQNDTPETCRTAHIREEPQLPFGDVGVAE
jgi:hypothetical protein